MIGGRELAASVVLVQLEKQFRDTLLEVINNHAMPEINSDNMSESAFKICNAIRDMSKLHQIASSSFLEASGIYRQLELHYGLNNDIHYTQKPGLFAEEIRTHADFKESVVYAISQALQGVEPQSREDLDATIQEAVTPVILKIMNTPPREEDIRKFLEGKTLGKDVVNFSYLNYMLWQLSLVNDIKAENSKAFLRCGVCETRLAYLSTILDDGALTEITNHLDKVLQ